MAVTISTVFYNVTPCSPVEDLWWLWRNITASIFRVWRLSKYDTDLIFRVMTSMITKFWEWICSLHLQFYTMKMEIAGACDTFITCYAVAYNPEDHSRNFHRHEKTGSQNKWSDATRTSAVADEGHSQEMWGCHVQWATRPSLHDNFFCFSMKCGLKLCFKHRSKLPLLGCDAF
jgi:hypothetical protein